MLDSGRQRTRSVILTTPELVEIRANQRTFEGAYVRTALGQFSFALVILKIFTPEFCGIGALFAAYGAAILATSLLRRQHSNRNFFAARNAGGGGGGGQFCTSASVVLTLAALSLVAYASLLVLVLRLDA